MNLLTMIRRVHTASAGLPCGEPVNGTIHDEEQDDEQNDDESVCKMMNKTTR